MNTEHKHTPGPWAFTTNNDGGIDIVCEPNGQGNGWHEIALDVDSEANAKLIAAATELLALLEGLVAGLLNRGSFSAKQCVEDELQAAIDLFSQNQRK